MSQADALLESISEYEPTGAYSYTLIDKSTGDRYSLYVSDGNLMMAELGANENGNEGGNNVPSVVPSVAIDDDEHVIVDDNRYITVPDNLKRIAVQGDHNVEVVTFDCIRYWDGVDLSTMRVYVNYKCSNGYSGSHLCSDVTVDETDANLIHFVWRIAGDVTRAAGPIKFNICIKQVDADGNESEHWNSEVNNEMYVSEGLEVLNTLSQRYPDIVTQILNRMDRLEECEVAVTGEEILALRQAIAAEVTARETAVNEEAKARADADTALSNRITNLENGGVNKANGDFTVTGTLTANKIIGAVYM